LGQLALQRVVWRSTQHVGCSAHYVHGVAPRATYCCTLLLAACAAALLECLAAGTAAEEGSQVGFCTLHQSYIHVLTRQTNSVSVCTQTAAHWRIWPQWHCSMLVHHAFHLHAALPRAVPFLIADRQLMLVKQVWMNASGTVLTCACDSCACLHLNRALV
jgi:hypothetical protein